MSDTLELSHWINGEKVSADRPSDEGRPADFDRFDYRERAYAAEAEA